MFPGGSGNTRGVEECFQVGQVTQWSGTVFPAGSGNTHGVEECFQLGQVTQWSRRVFPGGSGNTVEWKSVSRWVR